jgi:hypothetical protein
MVVVDNWSNEIDFEPIKDKNPITVLNAFKKIVKRPFLDMPYASIRIDSGTEFKGEFKKFFHDNNILLRVAIAGRHKQNIVAEIIKHARLADYPSFLEDEVMSKMMKRLTLMHSLNL